ncbi:MAG: Na/Pi cotransporter family protein [Deltaproteobacteria bacterium]|nr:Na/Pi cotransporter family protein [Deltaproteobacteria bacterium]
MQIISWAILWGGMAFFFYGLFLLREGLQHVAGDRLRGLLLRLTNNRLKGFGFGALVTMIFQSSSATTAMLVSFAGAGLLSLPQAFAVILGSDVGTTAVVFVIAERQLTHYALFGVAVGVGLRLWGPRSWWRYLGEVLFGFGLVCYGISLMVEAMQPLRESELVSIVFAHLATHPLLSIVGAALFAAAVHSSAATLGVALSLAMAGIVDLAGALPIVLGANIGTTITAVMAAVGRDLNSQRVAAAHVITKLGGAIAVFPLLPLAAASLQHVTNTLPWLQGPFHGALSLQIALAHLSFNLAIALLFLPFLPLGLRLVIRLLPGEPQPIAAFTPRYLDARTLETPSLAFTQVHREVVRLGNIAHELFLNSLDLFEKKEKVEQLIADVDQQDDYIDRLEKAIRFFLARLSQESLTPQQSRTQIRLLRIAGNFEEIGDAISKEMKVLARKQCDKQCTFSGEGWRELRNFHSHVDEIFTMTIACLTTRDAVLAGKIEVKTEALTELETYSRATHLQRLNEKLRESIETSSIHLDLLRILARVAAKLQQIAKLAISGD